MSTRSSTSTCATTPSICWTARRHVSRKWCSCPDLVGWRRPQVGASRASNATRPRPLAAARLAAAGDVQGLAGDVAVRGGAEEDDRGGHVVRGGQSAGGEVAGDLLADRLGNE